MKIWLICVQNGPHQWYEIIVPAATLEKAITKAYKQEEKKYPYMKGKLYISPYSCWETTPEIEARRPLDRARAAVTEAKEKLQKLQAEVKAARVELADAEHQLAQLAAEVDK